MQILSLELSPDRGIHSSEHDKPLMDFPFVLLNIFLLVYRDFTNFRSLDLRVSKLSVLQNGRFGWR